MESNKKISSLDYMSSNYPPQDMTLIQTRKDKTNEILNAGDALVDKLKPVDKIKPKRGRKPKPPTEAKLLKQADVAKRNKYKHEINELANQLYKDNKINHSLFNKMFNISNGAARIDRLKTSYDSLKIIRDKAEEAIKPSIFNQVLKHKRIQRQAKRNNLPEEIESDTFHFKSPPNGQSVLNVANKFYLNKNIEIPENKEYTFFETKQKTIFFYYKYDGDLMELARHLYEICNKQRFSFKCPSVLHLH